VSRRIDKLQPDVQKALNSAIVEMQSKGVNYFVNSTFRTIDEQKAYYAQGRQLLGVTNALRATVGFYFLSAKENEKIVTNCDGVIAKSQHQSGRAVDIVPVDKKGNPYWPATDSPLWKAIADVMTIHGFDAGLYWKKFPDAPHYEMKEGKI